MINAPSLGSSFAGGVVATRGPFRGCRKVSLDVTPNFSTPWYGPVHTNYRTCISLSLSLEPIAKRIVLEPRK